jgi:hypothetical protein
MTFQSTSPAFTLTLLNAENLYRFKNLPIRYQTLYKRESGSSGDPDYESSKNSTTKNNLLLIVMSAIISVAIISVYDVFRNAINNYYAEAALRDPKSNNTQSDIDSAVIDNQKGLIASVVFGIFCVIVAIILVVILVQFM